MRALKVFVFLLFVQSAVAQQTNTGSIQGVVVQSGAADAVIPNATVEIRRAGDVVSLAAAPLLTTMTDADGKYYFPVLTPGQYSITASVGGYVRTEYGQKRTNGAGLPISLASNQRINNADIAMTRTGSISGRVTDVNGQPVVLADVFALRPSYQEGQRTFVQVLSGKTDDRGEYKIFWITPGLYYVDLIVPDGQANFAMIMNADGLDTQGSLNANRSPSRDVLSRPIGTGAGPNEAHVPVYYPTTTDPRQARPLEVRSGQEIRVDFTALRVTTRSIRGTIFNAVTRQMPGGSSAQTRLLPFDPAQVPLEGTVDAQTGKFEYRRVPPGNYMLYAQMRPLAGTTPTNTPMWASMAVEIRDRDLEDLSLGVNSGVPMTGQVVLEDKSGATPVSLGGLFVGMRPDPLIGGNAPSPGTQTSADGAFSFPAVIPNKYRVYVIPLLAPNNPGLLSGLPPGPPGLTDRNVYVKAIRVGGKDVIDTGVVVSAGTDPLEMEIVLGANASGVEGRVVDEQKKPVDGAIVGLVPANASARGFRMDMYKSTATDASGKFHFQGLPPGEYKVFAWEDADKNAIIDQDFVLLHESAGIALQVQEGQKPTIEVTVIPAKVQTP